MRLVWLTDLHLNFVEARLRREFFASVGAAKPDGVLLGGDIGEAANLEGYLIEMAGALPGVPIYFVLGNHDFYGSSILAVRERAADLTARNGQLVWLTATGVIGLGEGAGLIGDDGWADGRLGNYFGSQVMLNDYLRIAEFIPSVRDPEARLRILSQLGDEAASRLKGKSRDACERGFRRILLLTHVPPFHEACWHEGALSNAEWLPHFSCRAVGDALIEVMEQFPRVELTVLCGHTHSSGVARIRPNLLVKTGSAQYGKPAIQEVIEWLTK